MKNLILLIAILYTGLSFAQGPYFNYDSSGEQQNSNLFIPNQIETPDNRTKLFCVTNSCCSFYFFTVEVWSETNCHYVSAEGKDECSVEFNSNEPISKINVPRDIILAGLYAENGNNFTLPQGTYEVDENNKIFFKPNQAKATRYCYERSVKGSFFGHEYSYSIKICIEFSSRSHSYGVASIEPMLSDEQLARLLESGEPIVFSENITIQEDDLNVNINAGEYTINKDGKAYMQSVRIR